MGYIGVITHLLAIDPYFQQDIQVGITPFRNTCNNLLVAAMKVYSLKNWLILGILGAFLERGKVIFYVYIVCIDILHQYLHIYTTLCTVDGNPVGCGMYKTLQIV